MKSVTSIIGLLSAALIMSSVSVELGYFLVLGLEFFSALSISDHISAVIRRLPIIIPLWAVTSFLGYQHGKSARDQDVSSKQRSRLGLGIEIVFFVGLCVILMFNTNWLAAIFLAASLGFALYAVNFMGPWLSGLNFSIKAKLLIVFLPVGFLFLVGYGASRAGERVSSLDSDWTIHKTDGSKIETEVLGVFSQGILVWDGEKVIYYLNASIARVEGEQERLPISSILELFVEFFGTSESETASSP